MLNKDFLMDFTLSSPLFFAEVVILIVESLLTCFELIVDTEDTVTEFFEDPTLFPLLPSSDNAIPLLLFANYSSLSELLLD